jgi:polysaccharide export outer membrane protein
VNLNQPAGGSHRVGNGDILRIARLRPQIDAGVELEGYVHRPGPLAWREGLRLSDVIGSVDELKPNADQNYVLIRREMGPDRRISILSADLTAALAAPGSGADVPLAPRDRIIVFDLAPGRERIIQPLLDELTLQSSLARPTEVVQIGGSVKAPGEYPLEPGMRISDLLRAGGNLDPAAFGGSAELSRYTLNDAGERRTELIVVDLAAVRRGDSNADILLQSADHLIIKETPDWRGRESVTLRGEVRFPGTYPIRRGETLLQLLERAGGLTTLAFPEGSAFTRRDLKEIEQQQLDRLAERLRSDLAALALQAANAGQASASEALQSGQSLLSQLQDAQATGRFVIDLPGLLAMEQGSVKDVLLRDGDELVIPKRRQEVSVIGEVQNATSHLYLPDLGRDDYVYLSGGTTKKADRGRIHIVRADGSVATRRGSWLARSYDVAIKPGDTIVVPLDTERMPRLPFWQAVTQILYNVAVSVAAVNSF